MPSTSCAHGAAVLLPESELTPVSLAAVLRELLEPGGRG